MGPMKRIYLLSVLLLLAIAATAQYREVKLPEKPKQGNYKDYSTAKSGFWGGIDVGGGSSVMAEQPNMQYVGVSVAGGYRLNEFLRMGVGVGARIYVHNHLVRNTTNRVGIPIFANVRGNFISAYDRDGVPFWSLNIGGITKEGFFASPTVGYSFGGLRHNFQIGVSYTISRFKNSTNTGVTYSYFGLKLGYEY